MYDVYMSDMNGENLRRIIDEASQPAARSDGRVIAFRRWRSDERGLETINLDSGSVRRYTTFLEDSSPAWSQDGGDIAFFSRRESDRQSRVYRVNVNDGEEVELRSETTALFGEMPAWQPGNRIVYRANFPQKGIAVANSDGSDSQIIVSDDEATAPVASADGQFVAFMSQKDGNWEIYRANIDGTDIRRLTQVAGNDGLPVWLPDGRTILFASDRGGAWGIYAMNPNGSSQRRLFALPGSIDGRVSGEPDYASRGWTEENISWSP
jgi:TolB protein